MSRHDVDERVVQMQFDNAQFERNVSQSMTTLDRLKERLKFTDSTKDFQAINNVAKGIDFSHLASSVDAINNRFSAFGIVGMTVLQRLTNAAIDLGSKLMSSVAIPLNQIKTGGWNRALNIENAMFKMQGLLEDFEEQQEKINENIDYAVSGTAYSYDAAASAMAQLTASGVEFRGESMNMKKALRAISGVAAMTNSDYSAIADIFTTVAGNGKVMTMQLNQIAGRGINAAAALGKQLGKSEAEIREMVHDGEIDFQTFANAMDNAFGEHAKKANETFTGALSNIKAALSRTGQGFAQSIQRYGRDILNAIRPNINLFNKAIQPLVTDFDRVMKHIADAFASVFGDGQTGKLNFDWVIDAIATLENLFYGLKGIIEEIGKGFSEIFPEASFISISDFFEKTRTYTDAFRSLFGDLRSEILGTAEDTTDAAEKEAEAAEDLSEIINQVIRGDYGNGSVRRKQLEELGYSYEKVQNGVNELLGCSFRYAIEEEEVADAEEEVVEQQESMSNSLLRIIVSDKQHASALKKIRTIASGIAATVKLIGGAAKAVFDIIIKPAAPKVLSLISDLLVWISERLISIQKKAEEFGFFEKLCQGIVDVFTDIVKHVESFYDWLIKLDSTQRLIENFGKLWEKLKTNIEKASQNAEKLSDALMSLPGVQRLMESLGSLKKFLGSNLDKLIGLIADGLERILNIDPADFSGALDLVDYMAGKLSLFINAFLGASAVAEEGLSGVHSVIKKISDLIDWNQIWSLIFMLLKFRALFNVGTIIGKLSKLAEFIALIPKNLAFVTEYASDAMWGLSQRIKSEALLNIAEAIYKLAVALTVLATLKSENLAQAVAAIAVIVLLMMALYKAMWKATSNLGTATEAVKMLRSSFVQWLKTMSRSFEILMRSGTLLAIAGSVLLFAAAVTVLIHAFIKLQKLKLGESNEAIKNTVAALGVLAFVMAAAVASAVLLSKFASKLTVSIGASLILLALSISIIAGAVKSLSSLTDPAAIASGLIGLASIVAALVISAVVLSKYATNFKPSMAISIVLFSAAISILSGAVKSLASVPLAALGTSLGALLLTLLGFVKIAESIKKENTPLMRLAGSMLLLSVALLVLSAPLKILSGIEFLPLISAVAALIITVGSLVFILSKASGLGKAGVGLIAVGIGVGVLSAALKSLSGLNWANIWQGLTIVAAVLATMIIFIKPLMLLATFSMEISMSLITMAAGVYLLVAAISLFVDIADDIVAKAPTIALAFLLVVAGIAAGIIAGQALMTLAGLTLIDSFLTAITASAPKLLTTIISFVTLALIFTAAAVSGMLDKFIALIVAAINAIADAIIKYADPIYNALGNLIDAIGVFLIKGVIHIIDDMLGSLIPGVHSMCADAEAALDSLYDSRKAYRDSQNITTGAAEGIREGTPDVVAASSELGEESSSAFGESFNLPGVVSDNSAGAVGALLGSTDSFSNATSLLANEGAASFTDGFNLTDIVGDETGIGIPSALTENGPLANDAMLDYIAQMSEGVPEAAEDGGSEIADSYYTGIGEGAAGSFTWEDLLNSDYESMMAGSDDAYNAGSQTGESYATGAEQAVASAGESGVQLVTATVEGTKEGDKDIFAAGENTGGSYAKGVSNQQGTSRIAGVGLKNAAINGASGAYRKMYNAGSDAGEGFYDGVNSWADAIADKTYNIVRDAVRSAKAAEDSNSPSKETRKLGVYFDQGFILGLEDLAGKVHSTAGNVASTGLSAMREAVSKIHDILASDMDYEPTIRPVMDLSDVEAGARMINNALSTSPTFTPTVSMTDSARISAMMQNAQISADTARISNVQDIDTLITTTNNILSILKDPRAVTIDGNTVIGWVDRELGAFS